MEVVDGVLPGDPAHLPQADDVAFLRFCQGNPPCPSASWMSPQTFLVSESL